ncbi:uncharacterized protein LOC142634772 [Castanea sativa]|uniref:uncharacterized protein LOC142634772 n=1 Tax=Castanea sativa TaxID=21020 RepID=UPI003F64D315
MTAALNRFISRSVDRCRPFFQLLHKWKRFEWIEKCSSAFQQLKEYLSRPPIMSKLEKEEVLFAYITVASHAVSLVLVQADNGEQKLVYYVTDYTGRIVKWGTILGDFDYKYMPRTSMKDQILADLVVEFAKPSLVENKERPNMDEKLVGMVAVQDLLPWKEYVDGAANQKGSGVGLVIMSLEWITIEKSLRLGFSAINNKAEYEACLAGMDMVRKMGGQAMEMFSNSRLVVGQVKGELEA